MVPAPAGHTLYGASKAFLIRFSEALAAENGPKGVNVTAVCPGFTWSEFHDVTGTRDRMNKMPGLLWLKADDVAREGYDAVMKGHSVVVNGAHLPFAGVADRRLAAQPGALGVGRGGPPLSQDVNGGTPAVRHDRITRHGRDPAERHSLRAALDAPQPRVFGGRDPVAGPRRRRQHRDVLAGRFAAVPAAAGHARPTRSSTSSPPAATATSTPPVPTRTSSTSRRRTPSSPT